MSAGVDERKGYKVESRARLIALGLRVWTRCVSPTMPEAFSKV